MRRSSVLSITMNGRGPSLSLNPVSHRVAAMPSCCALADGERPNLLHVLWMFGEMVKWPVPEYLKRTKKVARGIRHGTGNDGFSNAASWRVRETWQPAHPSGGSRSRPMLGSACGGVTAKRWRNRSCFMKTRTPGGEHSPFWRKRSCD